MAKNLFEKTCFVNPNVYFNNAFDECGKIESQGTIVKT